MMSRMKALAGIMTLLYVATILAPAFPMPLSTPLLADQTLSIGTVDISDDGTTLVVTFTITEADWYLMETHLAVNASLSDIPQTKKGNPIPGQFSYQAEFTPPSSDGTGGTTTWTMKFPSLL